MRVPSTRYTCVATPQSTVRSPRAGASRFRRLAAATATVLATGFVSAALVVNPAPPVGARVQLESTDWDRAEVRNLINQSRVQNRLGTLRPNAILDLKADGWAQYLRSICALKHSRLADGAPPGWFKLGENVGKGGSIGQVHEAYLRSPSHRANILDGSFTQVGTGAVWGNCDGYRTVFTVQEFMK